MIDPLDLADAEALVAVVEAGGFRQAARATGRSSSGLSASVRRLETRLQAQLLYRTTRAVVPTERGRRLLDRLRPLFAEAASAFGDVRGSSDRPAGTLRLNVPVSVARLILPDVLQGFLRSHPEIEVEVQAQSGMIDIHAAGFDAGVRYDETLPQDMVAVPIGPPVQRFATVAAPAYLARAGRPVHPSDLAAHACLRDRAASGRVPDWSFERNGERVTVEPRGPLVTGMGAAADLAVALAVSGLGVLHLFEDWVRPQIEAGDLVPILEPWWETFPGPRLYFPAGPFLPPPLRAFVDHLRLERKRADRDRGPGAPPLTSRPAPAG